MQQRFHYIQHVPFEGPGVILSWALGQGFTISSTRAWLGEAFPSVDNFDWLLIMGGPMSVGDEDMYPWLAEEKARIREAVEKEKKVIGICLGAQLIAAAMGSPVYGNAFREIGWFPLKASADAVHLPLTGLLDGLTAFHWHGDTFSLPEGATLLCSSEACANQAFMLGKSVLALQFHLEVDELAVEGMLEEMSRELNPERYVMGREGIMAGRVYLKANHRRMFALLDLMGESS